MSDRQYVLWAFRYLKPYQFSYGMGTFLYSMQGFVVPFMIGIFSGRVTAAVLDLSFAGVLDAIWLMVLIIVLVNFVLVGSGIYLYFMSITYAKRDMSMDLFEAFMRSNTESQAHSGEGIAALNTDIETASHIFSDAFTPFLMNVMAVVFSMITVFVIDWRMGLGALLIGLFVFFAQSRFSTPLARIGKAQLETNAESVKSLSNIFAGMLTIKAFNRQERSLVQFDRENGKLEKLAFKLAFIGMWQDLFTTVQGWLTLVLVFALGGWLVIIGEIDFALIMMVLPLALAMNRAMSQIGTTFANLKPPIVAVKRIADLIDSAPKADQVQSEKKDDWTGRYDISMNQLSFSYQDATTKAINDIDLSIKENEIIAIVGESGSGKSTLLRLIIGMYAHEGLNMKIGDLSFTLENMNEWRSRFAYVDQSCQLFDMNIAQNIAMGCQGNASDDQIQAAAKRALAHDFITELPQGYETPCGEGGASLSGGQKQRLAIARALCKKAPVLVFDEATAALDAENARGMMETIHQLRQDHTILMTTHHLNNMSAVDKIVVMDKGRIAESGTHTELLEKDGFYKKLLMESNDE